MSTQTAAMADPLSVSSGIVALVAFAFQSSHILYTIVRSLQSRDKKARALKDELSDLTAVLESLLETVNNNPDINFDALRLPLYRCGKTCEDYGVIIKRCTKHSTASRPSLRDWITQKYMQGDITDIKEMLAVYKSTINIALANANIRVAAITPRVLEEYKDMIRDATADLQEHLQKLEQREQSFATEDAGAPAQDNVEWQALLEEKKSTQQGLRICDQLSAQIDQLEPTSNEHPQFLRRPSAHKYIKNGLDTARSSIQSLISRLQSHADAIGRQVEAMESTAQASEQGAAQLAQLQETKESIRQCIDVVVEAGETVAEERRNVFEDITMADNSYSITVSTVKDLVTARRVNLTGRARHLGGQISDESYQRTIDALTKLDMSYNGQTEELDPTAPSIEPENEHGTAADFDGRYGQGRKLPPSDT